jgi:hypothetical protein
MRSPPLRGPLAFLPPPLKPRMRDMMLNPLPQACCDFGFDLTQRGQHRLLLLRRIQPRKVPL